MAPKIVDKEQKKKEIAVTALDVFSDKGFEGASMSYIAEKANIAKGSLYDYFSSKDELILYSMKVWIQIMEEESGKQVVDIKDPVKRLKALLKTYMDVFLADKRMIKLSGFMFQLMLSDKLKIQQRKKIYKASVEAGQKTVIDLLNEGVKKGIFKKYVSRDAEKIALNIMACLDGIGFHFHINEDQLKLKEQVDIYINALIDSMRV